MRFNWNKKYTTIAIYAAIVILFGVFSVFFFINYSDFGKYTSIIGAAIRPFIFGIIMAYLIWPILKLFENKVFAYLTGDDKIPEIPVKPQIPDVPEKPEKPEKPAFDKSVSGSDRLMALELYREALKAYYAASKEYRRAVSKRNAAIRKCASIERNTPRIERKISRVTARHLRISEAKRKDGSPKTNYALRRGLSTLCAVLIAVIFLALFIYMVAPQVAAGYTELTSMLPVYITSVSSWLRSVGESADYLGNIVNGLVDYINNFLATISGFIQDLLPSIATLLKNIVVTIKDIVIGICFAIYFLLGKERVIAKIKKFFRAIFTERAYSRLSKTGRDLNKNFGSFISAKIIDSLIMGVITFFVLLIFGMPYYPLIAVIIGITNFVPIFGPVVGAVIGGFIVFITDPTKVIPFVIIMIVLQQFDGNFIGPRLMGTQTNTTSLGILAALTVFSSIWGFTGLLIAVPLFVVIYSLIKEKSEQRLKRKGYPSETEDYYDPDDKMGHGLYNEAAAKVKRKNKKVPSSDETEEVADNQTGSVDFIERSPENEETAPYADDEPPKDDPTHE